jgi:Zn-dependent peptidase ImmA (M78 family)/predicted secreted protein
MGLGALDLARRQGFRAAYKEHQRLGTRVDRQVDIFAAIENAGIWLMFQPLGRLFGAYQRPRGTPGILINSKHPLTLQRFTAAHEYAHHVLGHDSHLDVYEQIEAPSRTPEEAAAQAFAGAFLMPLHLVNRELRDLGLPISHPPLTAEIVYRLALEFGASYSAAVTQLEVLNKISSALAGRLKRERPIAIKTVLAGQPPHMTRADVWLIDETQSGRELMPRIDDEVHVLLPETPSTGYVWTIGRDADSVTREAVLPLVRDTLEVETQSGGLLYGAGGRRHFVFRAARPGSYRCHFTLVRPWDEPAPPEAEFQVTLRTQHRVTGDSEHGLADAQKRLLGVG